MTHDTPNESPDFWEAVYDACKLDAVPEAPCFDTFLEDPWRYLTELGQAEAVASMAHGFEPLLPAQAAIARRLQAEEAEQRQQAQARRHERMIQPTPVKDAAPALH